MEDRFVAMEGFLDKFRKSKLSTVVSKNDQNLPKYPTADAMVQAITDGSLEKDKNGEYEAIVHNVMVSIHGYGNVTDPQYAKTIIGNVINNASAIHKSLCMGELDLYNSSKGSEGPWQWSQFSRGPYKKRGLSDIEGQIRLSFIRINFIASGGVSIQYFFDDGPEMLYGGHDLVVDAATSDYKFAKNAHAKLKEDGKYISPVAGKFLGCDLYG